LSSPSSQSYTPNRDCTMIDNNNSSNHTTY
jgi:hypothetical protein